MATSGARARRRFVGASRGDHVPVASILPGAEAESRDDQSATGKYVAGAVLFPMLLIAGVFGAFSVDHPTRGFRQGATMRGAHTLVLETSCVARDVREQMPAFFRPGYSVVGASVVHHDAASERAAKRNEGGVGETEEARASGGVHARRPTPRALVEMRPVSPYDLLGEPRGRFIAEHVELDGEWGFALRNNFGDVFYESGADASAPMWGKACGGGGPKGGIGFNERIAMALKRLTRWDGGGSGGGGRRRARGDGKLRVRVVFETVRGGGGGGGGRRRGRTERTRGRTRRRLGGIRREEGGETRRRVNGRRPRFGLGGLGFHLGSRAKRDAKRSETREKDGARKEGAREQKRTNE